MNRKRIWLIVAAAAFLAAGACAYGVWQNQKEKRDAQKMYEELRQEAKSSEKSDMRDTPGAETDISLADETQTTSLQMDGNGTGAASAQQTEVAAEVQSRQSGETEVHSSESETEAETQTELQIPVDFEELQEINPDIYAWITVPGTVIDYPIVQNEDNTYYLTRSAEGEDSVAGAIFSETFNEKDFCDVHNVLYGHNMKDGSMFADLHLFEDEEFFEKHKEIVIYTPDSIGYYRIFAAYLYDDRHLLQSYDCSDPVVFEAYIKEILGQRNLYAHIDKEAEIGEEDRILTLSTCHSMGNSSRYLVQAVLEEGYGLLGKEREKSPGREEDGDLEENSAKEEKDNGDLEENPIEEDTDGKEEAHGKE